MGFRLQHLKRLMKTTTMMITINGMPEVLDAAVFVSTLNHRPLTLV